MNGDEPRGSRHRELLWNDELQKWFSEELATPNLMLMRVTIEEAEYWDERVPSTDGLLSEEG